MRAAPEAVLVAAGCLALYLAGAGDVPFYTRGEPREGLVAREMLRSGAWLVPARPEGELARKPPLYYWAAAGALGALPERPELALRLPSAVLGTAAVLGTWATARAAWGAAAGLPAALVLATTFEWTRAAVSARVDMALAAALTAALAGWTLALARGTRGAAVLAALGAALGTLAKGPVALVLPGLAAAGLRLARRELRSLHVVPVLGAAAALAGLWYAVAFAREGSALLDVVARENWLRFVDPEGAATGHAHAAGYLVPLGLVGLVPWTPLLPLALVPLRARPWPAAAALAASWVATGVVFFSLAAAKRSVYLLPLHPAVALLLGAGVAAPPAGGPSSSRRPRSGSRRSPAPSSSVSIPSRVCSPGSGPTTRRGRRRSPRRG
ncbi:MAG TPA: glycosyltransferase family 39 protein, partial [Verrucomicrobiae bacterium]|nr:glycosyltransferase family 39 protein [Verrucomicrobiae bacterium]